MSSRLESLGQEISALKPDIKDIIGRRDSGAQLLRVLSSNVAPVDVATAAGDKVWESCGSYLSESGRTHEALILFLKLYELKLAAQLTLGRVHKGAPLIWISYCFAQLGFPVHAKRYAMLAFCEDAVEGKGRVSPDGGAYFRLMWLGGMREEELNAYARQVFLFQQDPQLGQYPEALLQRLDNKWVREAPSSGESFYYVVSETYVDFLLRKADARDDRAFEDLAEYLISCMAGCRCGKRKQSPSTEYDLICSVEGIPMDFRSEWGRYFVCECKNSKYKIGFTDFAKFCRILDSVKAKFGIMFSRMGIENSAIREQQKIFQDRGITLIALDLDDLKQIANGSNLISLLRSRYEAIRLDLC
jgi:hypothetical protein